jgi:hypothetical protein
MPLARNATIDLLLNDIDPGLRNITLLMVALLGVIAPMLCMWWTRDIGRYCFCCLYYHCVNSVCPGVPCHCILRNLPCCCSCCHATCAESTTIVAEIASIIVTVAAIDAVLISTTAKMWTGLIFPGYALLRVMLYFFCRKGCACCVGHKVISHDNSTTLLCPRAFSAEKKKKSPKKRNKQRLAS